MDEKSEAQGGEAVNRITVGTKWLNNKTPVAMFVTADAIASEFLLKGGIHVQLRPQSKGCSYFQEVWV